MSSSTSSIGARRAPSSIASSTSPRRLSPASTSAASTQAITAHANTTTTNSSSLSLLPLHHQQQQQQPPLQPTLPSAETQRHIAQARAAVVASMGNMLDSELQSRAQMLHDNAGALDKQERDVLRATEGLRRETDKLAREADVAAKRLKEVGNVQNWAEVLERGFLVLEETVRLANGGSEAGSSCSCSCSECGDVSDGEGMDLDHDVEGEGEEEYVEEENVLSDGEGAGSAWSDASRSLMDGGSSTTGRAKGSETASVSTMS